MIPTPLHSDGSSLLPKYLASFSQTQQFRCSWGLLQRRKLTPSNAEGPVSTLASVIYINKQCQSSAWIWSSKLKLIALKRQAAKKALKKFENHFNTYDQRHQLQPYHYRFVFLTPAQASEIGNRSSLALSWVQTFLWKGLGNSDALVDIIWSRITQYSRY